MFEPTAEPKVKYPSVPSSYTHTYQLPDGGGKGRETHLVHYRCASD